MRLGVGLTAGALALKGDVCEHRAAPERSGAVAREARAAGDPQGVDGLVIPGGESTSIGTLTDVCGLAEPIRRFHRGGAAELRALHGVRHAAASVNF